MSQDLGWISGETRLILALAWCVERDIKPAASETIPTQALEETLEALKAARPTVKITVRPEQGDQSTVFMYKYDHVRTLYEHADAVQDEALFHAIKGYVFGIPPHQIEAFINDGGSMKRRRK